MNTIRTNFVVALALVPSLILGSSGLAFAGPSRKAQAEKAGAPAKAENGKAAAGEEAAEPEASVGDSMIDVHVGETLSRAESLSAKIREDVVRVLQAHRIELDAQESVRLSIGVGGEDYKYRVSMGVLKNGSIVTPAPEPWTCDCTAEELLVRVSQGVVDLLPVLKDEPDAAAANGPASDAAPAQPAEAAPTGDGDRQQTRLTARGKAGVAVLVVGSGVALTGVALAASLRKDAFDPTGLETDERKTSMHNAGYAMIGVGVAAIVVGAVLVGLDRRKGRRARTSFVPQIGPRLTGFSLSTRF